MMTNHKTEMMSDFLKTIQKIQPVEFKIKQKYLNHDFINNIANDYLEKVDNVLIDLNNQLKAYNIKCFLVYYDDDYDSVLQILSKDAIRHDEAFFNTPTKFFDELNINKSIIDSIFTTTNVVTDFEIVKEKYKFIRICDDYIEETKSL